MKKLYIIIAVILLTISANAQAPEQMSYQAVIRDASNALVTSQAIGMQISILKGIATGTAVYTETQTANTNTGGLVSLEIGTGTTSDDFSTINWANDTYFIKVETDPTGGSNYTVTGISQLLSVPYALYAKNSGDKVFSTTNNVTSNANGDIANDDFVFGKAQLDDEGSRMFFNKSKAAFRAGSSAGMGLEWSDSNIGDYSFAAGINTKANAQYSTALGKSTTASGDAATAMGNSTTALGNASTAMGSSTTAESYAQTTLGTNNTTSTGDASTFVPTDRLLVVGNGANNTTKSDALIILKNGTITAPSLDIAEITDNKALVTKEYVDAKPATGLEKITEGGNTGWRLVGQDAANYGDIGENAVDISYNNISFYLRGARGDYSTAMGFGTTALGLASVAMGDQAAAIGYSSVAMGGSSAQGMYSIAMGDSSAQGDFSTAMGRGITAETHAQTSIGYYNTVVAGSVTSFVATDRLFVIGNGIPTTRSDAMVVLKNGNTTINGDLKVDEVNATDSGDADMKAYIYGLVGAAGGGSDVNTDGFVISKIGTGHYRITFNVYMTRTKYITVATLHDAIGFVNLIRDHGYFDVKTYNTAGALADKGFYFVTYKK